MDLIYLARVSMTSHSLVPEGTALFSFYFYLKVCYLKQKTYNIQSGLFLKLCEYRLISLFDICLSYFPYFHEMERCKFTDWRLDFFLPAPALTKRILSLWNMGYWSIKRREEGRFISADDAAEEVQLGHGGVTLRRSLLSHSFVSRSSALLSSGGTACTYE